MLTVSFIQYTKDYNWKYIDTCIVLMSPVSAMKMFHILIELERLISILQVLPSTRG